jgi:hypothetical protein
MADHWATAGCGADKAAASTIAAMARTCDFAVNISNLQLPLSVQRQRQAWGLRERTAEGGYMVFTAASLSPVLAILFGVLIFMFPRLLNYLVATYLVLTGLIGLGVVSLNV